MTSESDDEVFRKYTEDSRIPCKYSVKCYQKNPAHHNKYKHPPSKNEKQETITATKRKKVNNEEGNIESTSFSPPSKVQKIIPTSPKLIESILEIDSNDATVSDNENKQVFEKNIDMEEIAATNSKRNIDHIGENRNEDEEIIIVKNIRNAIQELFLMSMPEDFYKLYEFCESVSPDNPKTVFKMLDLELVGPYDLMKTKSLKINGRERFLNHWRYYYDPPEFQTIIKGTNKDGLHFGYWRDDPSELPIFVAKNRAKINCVFEPVAENIFGALNMHFEDNLKTVDIFQRNKMSQIHNKLKKFANEYGFTLDIKTTNMRNREKKVVARTFYQTGIVVPYDKKTQVGYRELAVTDSELKKILKNIKEGDIDQKEASQVKLEEVVRLGVIATDECDFGTCLELGHDLLASGVTDVQNTALQMLSIAYTQLKRIKFLEIVKTHLKNRRKTDNLSTI